MKNNEHLLSFNIQNKSYALLVGEIEIIVPAAEVTSLPGLPPVFYGVINYHGDIIPVIDTRYLLKLPYKDIEVSDMFIIAKTNKRVICIVADSINEVINYTDEEITEKELISPNLTLIKGLLKDKGNIIIICNLDNFISHEEDEIFKKISKQL